MLPTITEGLEDPAYEQCYKGLLQFCLPTGITARFQLHLTKFHMLIIVNHT